MKVIKYILLSILLVLSETLLSQTKGIIIDIKTNNPIPFANIWIENEEIGTTSSKEGLFHFKEDLKHKKIVVSSIGYEKKIILIDTSFVQLYLTPIIYKVPEVLIKPKKSFEVKIGHYRKLQIFRYTAPVTPQIYARFFQYEENYSRTPILNKIKFETFSKNDAIFNLRIFSIGKDNKPEKDLLPNNYLIKIKNGKRSTIIKIPDEEAIFFPKEGLFVAVEYLIIKENEYQYSYVDKDSGKARQIIGYMPMFGVIKTDTNQNSWTYREGKWFLDLAKNEDEMNDETKNNFLAVELTLSN